MLKKCQANCKAYEHLWLRNNIFYYMVELPRKNGKRRYYYKSLRTNNYYEAREKAKLMNEVNIDVLVSRIEHLLSQVNFVYAFKDNGQVLETPTISANTAPGILQALLDIRTEVELLRKTVQNLDKQYLNTFDKYDNILKAIQIQGGISGIINTSGNAATVSNGYTISEILESMLKKANNVIHEQNKKRNTISGMIEAVNLSLDDDYSKFYKPNIIQDICTNILNNDKIKGDTKRKHARYLKELIKHANILNPNAYSINLLNIIPNIAKTKKSEKRPHIPYSDDFLLQMFDPKHKYFLTHSDDFWSALVALFTGARLNAATTLQYGDIISEDGMDCIRFIRNHPIKQLKNEASERTVPIAKQLINLGFVEYVKRRKDMLKAADSDFIFPKCITKNNSFNLHFATRGVFKFLTDIGIKQPNGEKLDFHSFRKNASLKLQDVGVLPAFINDIIGWEGKSIMEQSYSNHTLAQIKTEVDKLEYTFLQPHFDKWAQLMKNVTK